MDKILCMITYMFILFSCHMFFVEGRQIRSLSEVVTNYVKSPSHIGNRKLSSQTHKSDFSEISPKKTTPQQQSADLFQTEKSKKNQPSLKTQSSQTSSNEANSVWVNKVESPVVSNCLGVKCTDDFRPTAPGHSPGAGHLFVTSTDKTSPNKPTKHFKIWKSLATSGGDMKHTAPGRSPGAGHAEVDSKDPKFSTVKAQNFFPSTSTPSSYFHESALVSTNEFQSPSPSSSSGADHSDTKKCLAEKCTGDFRPTTPGHSPGDGHLIIRNSDNITSEQGKHPNVAHPHEEGTDDFRPTKPGHSPGAGHSFIDTAEPHS